MSTTGQTGSATPPAELVKNADDFDAQLAALDSDQHTFVAKYPGVLGNSLQVSVCPANDSAFDAWTYKSSFDAAPSTSSFATSKSATEDEVHVAVVDLDGGVTGTAGTVLETFPFLSQASDAKNPDGTINYMKEAINERSEYVWMVNFDSDYSFGGTAATSGKDFNSLNAHTNYAFTQGVNSAALTTAEYATGHDLFEDKDTVEVDFLIAPGMGTTTDQTTIVNDLISTAQSTRKDCVVVLSLIHI